MNGSTGLGGLDDCPVREDYFARLMKEPSSSCADLAQQLPEDTRAQLAVFCYRRSHLRRLGLIIAGTCSKQALVRESGHAGELIHLQAQNLEATLTGDRYMAPRYMRKPVSLSG